MLFLFFFRNGGKTYRFQCTFSRGKAFMMYFFPEISTQRKVKQRKAKQRKEKPLKRKDFAADGETVERRSGGNKAAPE